LNKGPVRSREKCPARAMLDAASSLRQYDCLTKYRIVPTGKRARLR
jgi:hypothetical protein